MRGGQRWSKTPTMPQLPPIGGWPLEGAHAKPPSPPPLWRPSAASEGSLAFVRGQGCAPPAASVASGATLHLAQQPVPVVLRWVRTWPTAASRPVANLDAVQLAPVECLAERAHCCAAHRGAARHKVQVTLIVVRIEVRDRHAPCALRY